MTESVTSAAELRQGSVGGEYGRLTATNDRANRPGQGSGRHSAIHLDAPESKNLNRLQTFRVFSSPPTKLYFGVK